MIRGLLLMLFTSTCLAAEPPRLADFAYAADIRTEGEGALYRLDLPEAVYSGLTRADLGDLRIFNAAGNLVPQSLILSRDEQARATVRHGLPLFPLYVDGPRELLDIRLRMERRDQGQSIELERSGSVNIATERLSGYILDARGLDSPVDRFTLSWADRDFLLRLDLEAGDDLEHWRKVAEQVTLADLHHLGHHLKRERIGVKPVKARYFRIRFADPAKAVRLTGVQARTSRSTHITHYQELELEVKPGPEAGEYRFELSQAMTGERLRIRLPEVNTLAGATLESRRAQDQPWRERRRATLYRLRQHGVELEHEDLSLGRRQDRQWRLRVDQSSGGLGPGLPLLKLLWRPHELRFVARGEGPYTLAWGSARPLPAQPPGADAMLRSTGIAPLPASVGSQVRRLSGDSVLRPQINWRQWLLWGVLVLGALLLVWMAMRLFRQMNPG